VRRELERERRVLAEPLPFIQTVEAVIASSESMNI
jgi:hypothetical protein